MNDRTAFLALVSFASNTLKSNEQINIRLEKCQ